MCRQSLQQNRNPILAVTQVLVVIFAVVCVLNSAPGDANPISGQEDDRYVEREYPSSNPGAHELATWLISQLRQSNNQATNSVTNGCKYPSLVKRNSEIINSLLRLPQIDNGRK